MGFTESKSEVKLVTFLFNSARKVIMAETSTKPNTPIAMATKPGFNRIPATCTLPLEVTWMKPARSVARCQILQHTVAEP